MSIVQAPQAKAPVTSAVAERASLRAHCSFYSEAKSQIGRALAEHPHVWIEAHPSRPDPGLRLAQPDPISYAVHASAKGADVPPFAIEVYEQGALARYEVNRQRIQELAAMTESERQTVIRAARLRAQLEGGESAPQAPSPGWSGRSI